MRLGVPGISSSHGRLMSPPRRHAARTEDAGERIKRMSLPLTLHLAMAAMRNAVAPRIQHLTLHVTRRCPLRCAHCYATPGDDDLTAAEAQTLARDLNPLLWLQIGGGEPFLRRDLPELCRPFRVRSLTIPTSGWLVDETIETARRLHGVFGARLTILVSLDGFQETHDRLRRRPGSFERAIVTLRGLKSVAGLRAGIVTTICAANAEELEDFTRSLRPFEPHFHAFNLLRGNPRDPSVRLPGMETLARLTPALFATGNGSDAVPMNSWTRIRRDMGATYRRSLWETQMRTLAEKRQVLPCQAARSHLVVYADGDVAPCEMLPPVGNIRRRPLAGIVRSAEMKSAAKRIRAGECWCTHECALMDGISLLPRPLAHLILGGLRKPPRRAAPD